MTFQAYLDTIQAKTGKTPEDFISMATAKGLVDYRALMTWLKSDYGLGHGHANAMAHVILGTFEAKAELTLDERIAQFFVGDKTSWRRYFDDLIERLKQF